MLWLSRRSVGKRSPRECDFTSEAISFAHQSVQADQIGAMITAVLFVILVSIIVSYLLHFAYEKPTKNYPPGPPKIPFFGSYAFMLLKDYKWTAKVCSYWGKVYNSDIVAFFFGIYPVISLNSLESIKTFFNTPEFDGRMDIYPARYRSLGERFGIFFSDGPEWHVQKRFSLRFMRDFGFGRRCPNLESIIEHEMKYFLEICEKGPSTLGEKLLIKEDGVVLMPDILNIPMVYPMLSVVTNKTWTRETDDGIRKIAKDGLYLQRSIDDLGGFLTIEPNLRHVAPYLTGYDWLQRGHKPLFNFAKEVINDMIKTQDPKEDYDRNFIDMYLRRMNNELENKGYSAFSETQLILVLSDYLFPTMTANSQQLLFLIKQVINCPEIQQKAFEEIDRVVGRGRLPNLSDRPDLAYNEACIREVLRRWTLVHFAIPHRAVKDTVFMGYDIPTDTCIVPNLLHMHMDENIWGDPLNFRPERFLDEDGKLSLKKDVSLPYGAGRRLCAGETYSRNIMFLTFTALVQNFVMTTPDGKLPALEEDCIPGIIMTTSDCWVKLKPRN